MAQIQADALGVKVRQGHLINGQGAGRGVKVLGRVDVRAGVVRHGEVVRRAPEGGRAGDHGLVRVPLGHDEGRVEGVALSERCRSGRLRSTIVGFAGAVDAVLYGRRAVALPGSRARRGEPELEICLAILIILVCSFDFLPLGSSRGILQADSRHGLNPEILLVRQKTLHEHR